MESKYLQMLMVYGFFILLKLKLLITSRVAPATIAKGPIISTLIWCFLFNCWNKHYIIVEVHRNTETFDFPKKVLIKIFRRIFRELRFLLTSNAYGQLTCLNLEEKIPPVEVLA